MVMVRILDKIHIKVRGGINFETRCGKSTIGAKNVSGDYETMKLVCVACRSLHERQSYKGYHIYKNGENMYSIFLGKNKVTDSALYSDKACRNVIDTILRAQKQNEEKNYR